MDTVPNLDVPAIARFAAFQSDSCRLADRIRSLEETLLGARAADQRPDRDARRGSGRTVNTSTPVAGAGAGALSDGSGIGATPPAPF